jgi:hypothetical protein
VSKSPAVLPVASPERSRVRVLPLMIHSGPVAAADRLAVARPGDGAAAAHPAVETSASASRTARQVG